VIYAKPEKIQSLEQEIKMLTLFLFEKLQEKVRIFVENRLLALQEKNLMKR